MTRLTVIIPTRETGLGPDNPTVSSLRAQTFKDFKAVVVLDQRMGANWARNVGFRTAVDTELVMFCDDDICWQPDAFEKMVACLDKHPEASYVYCGYKMGKELYCMRSFSADLLMRVNFVSTMTIIRTVDFPGFDEDIHRFQDWDLWLTMLEQGKVGVWCSECLFETAIRAGITHNNELTPHTATEVIRKKHKL